MAFAKLKQKCFLSQHALLENPENSTYQINIKVEFMNMQVFLTKNINNFSAPKSELKELLSK